MVKITVLPVTKAKRYTPLEPALGISIQDATITERKTVIPKYRYKNSISLFFEDTDKTDDYGAMTKIQAEHIIDFLDQNFDKDIQEIMVHCNAGWSRSQAVGLFIARYFVKSDKLFWKMLNDPDKRPGGNPHVYELLEDVYLEGLKNNVAKG